MFKGSWKAFCVVTMLLSLTVGVGCPSVSSGELPSDGPNNVPVSQNDANMSPSSASEADVPVSNDELTNAEFPNMDQLLEMLANNGFPNIPAANIVTSYGSQNSNSPVADPGAPPVENPTEVPPIDNTPPSTPPAAPTLVLTSGAFAPNGSIPQKYTGDGLNLSPSLNWTGAPANTQEFVVIVDDTDANFVHWVIYGIPAATTGLVEGIPTLGQLSAPAGARQGVNDFATTGYGGPYPPQGDPVHHYRFTVYALDTHLTLTAGFTSGDVHAAMTNHILAQAERVGTYAR